MGRARSWSAGANGRLTAVDVDAQEQLLSGARCVLAQHEVPEDAVARAAALTRGHFVLNPAPGRPVARALLRRVDVLVPNRLELAAVLDRPAPTGEASVLALARELAGPSTVVVVTLGPDGALVVSGDAATPVPAPKVAAVDTTAAGDSFCAGFVDALLDGADPVEAAGHAVRVAAVTVTRPGALDSLPRRDELRLPESR
jgi:ribokinase